MANKRDAILALYRSDVTAFVRFAFAILHPGQKLTWYWYLDVIADAVEAVLRGRNNRLVINAPPRTLKTLIATLVLIAMYLGRNPNKQVHLVVGTSALGSELMKKLRRLMGSERYRSLFPDLKLTMAKTTIHSQHGGGLRVLVVNQQSSGHGADLIVIDDPLSPSHASDDHTRKAANGWVTEELLQRQNNRKECRIVLVMQRVHSSDLSNHLRHPDRGFRYVVLPSIATSDERWVLFDGRCLSRKRGQVLKPDTDSPEQQMDLWEEVRDYTYATQFLQDTCGSVNGPLQMRWEPKGPDWSPENWSLRGGSCRVTYQQVIMHKAFGHAMPIYATWPQHPPQKTREEWEAGAAVHTRRMDELREDPSTGASWGTPFEDRLKWKHDISWDPSLRKAWLIKNSVGAVKKAAAQ